VASRILWLWDNQWIQELPGDGALGHCIREFKSRWGEEKTKSESFCVATDVENGASFIQAVLFGVRQVKIEMKYKVSLPLSISVEMWIRKKKYKERKEQNETKKARFGNLCKISQYGYQLNLYMQLMMRNLLNCSYIKIKKISVVLVSKRTISTERPPQLVSTFADRGCRVVRARDPHSRILGSLDRSGY
jgi:hypothetical protein